MNLEKRIKTFSALGNIFLAVAKKDKKLLKNKDFEKYFDALDLAVKRSFEQNRWFIDRFVRYQLKALGEQLTENNLKNWLSPYFQQIENIKPKKTGVVFAGNIPLVGFMDMLYILISGHKLIAKLSSKDKILPKITAEILTALLPEFKEYIFLTEDKLTDYQAVIATGSDNSARYFEYYFSKVPHIIRKNRTSVAIIYGNEKKQDFEGLADDILLYFGLGCRNVSKIYIPENFDFNLIFNALYKYSFVLENPKYQNNYIYNRTIFLINKQKFLENGFFIIKENISTASPVSVLYFEYYNKPDNIEKYLIPQKDKIQVVVSKNKLTNFKTVDFGKTQIVKPDDYADGVNVLEFLLNI